MAVRMEALGIEGHRVDPFKVAAVHRPVDIYNEKPEFSKLIDLIEPEASSDWYKIGIQLKQEPNQLDLLQQNVSGKMEQVFAQWKKSPKPGAPYTWGTILDVLETQTVAQFALANKIRENLKNDSFHQENIVTSRWELYQDHDDVETKDDVDDDGYYSDDKFCECGECSFEDVLNYGCSKFGLTKRFPILDINKLPSKQREKYIGILEKEARRISFLFASVKDDFLVSLKSRNIDYTRVKGFIKSTWYLSEKFSYLHRKLENSKDMNDVFDVVTDISSWFNHHPLESLVKQFGSNEDKSSYQAFLDNELKKYLQRSVTEIPKDGLGAQPFKGSGHFKLKVIHQKCHEDVIGEQILYLKVRVAEVLDIPIECLQLCDIRKGCLELYFSIPLFFYNKIFCPLSDHHLQALTSIEINGSNVPIQVTSVSCEDYYPKEKFTVEVKDDPYKKAFQDQDSVVLCMGSAGAGKTSTGSTIMSRYLHSILQTMMRTVEDKTKEISALQMKKRNLPTDIVCTSEHYPQALINSSTVVKDQVQNIQENEISTILRKAAAKQKEVQPFLHIWDCGGQPAFLEILPALLTPSTMFLLLFSAFKELDDKWQSVQNLDGQQSFEKEVDETTADLMINWMSTIHRHHANHITVKGLSNHDTVKGLSNHDTVKGLSDFLHLYINSKWFVNTLGKVQPLYVKVWEEYKNDIDSEDMMEQLESLHLVTQVHTKEYAHHARHYFLPAKHYFLPAILKGYRGDPSEAPPGHKQRATPLHITFPTRIVPLGVCTCLATTMAKESINELVFDYDICCNRVTFFHSQPPMDQLILTDLNTVIQVDLLRYTPDGRGIPSFEDVCQVLVKEVKDALYSHHREIIDQSYHEIADLCASCNQSCGLTATWKSLFVPKGDSLSSKPSMELAMQYLTTISHKWNDLGLKLGVNHKKLSKIDRKSGSVTRKLGKVLNFWLKKTPSPTWHHIITAVESGPIKDMALGAEIRSKLNYSYCNSYFILIG